jgi:hypothetical protein
VQASDVPERYGAAIDERGVLLCASAGAQVLLHRALHGGRNMMRPELVIVDGFLGDPHATRKLALDQVYTKMGSAGRRSAARFHHDVDPSVFEVLLHRKILDWEEQPINGRFQICTSEDPIVYHADDQSHAGIIFLTPDAPVESGLTLVRSKRTGVRHSQESVTLLSETFDGALFDSTKWEAVDKIGNVYNRLVLWDARLIHAASCYFGTKPDDARLFQMFFFNCD